MAKLLVHESAGVREFELVDNEVSIGRELDNTLRLADPSISRHHAVIRHMADGFQIQDLESSNGVLINGHKLANSLLQNGDRVTLGQLHLIFEDPEQVKQPDATATLRMEQKPHNPLGTTRLDPAMMAKIHAEQKQDFAGISEDTASPVYVPPPPSMSRGGNHESLWSRLKAFFHRFF